MYIDRNGFPVAKIAVLTSVSNRIAFAIDWGPNDPKNRNGTFESGNKLIIELMALRNALETAKAHRIEELTVLHSSRQLSEEMNRWEKVSRNQEAGLRNQELMRPIFKLKFESFDDVQIKEVSSEELRTAFATAKALIDLDSIETNVVHVFGNSTRTLPVRAAYAVYWGHQDPRNECGGVDGPQTHRRAQMMAVWVALATAVNCGIKHLTIRSRSYEMEVFINSGAFWDKEMQQHTDLLRRIADLRPKFLTLRHKLASSGHEDCRSQSAAGDMARRHRSFVTAKVVINGILTPEGVARYGVWFGNCSRLNESGRLSGRQSLFRVAMLALQRALEICVTNHIRFLTLFTPSPTIHAFVNVSKDMFSKTDWKIGDTTHPNADIGRKICELWKLLSVELSDNKCPDTTDVDSLAKSVQLGRCEAVFTSGACDSHPRGGDNAGFGVFWKEGDDKNYSGELLGTQRLFQAACEAVRKALEIAVLKKIERLMVYSDCELVIRTIHETWKDDEFLVEIRNLEAKMKNVEYLFRENENAKRMAWQAMQ